MLTFRGDAIELSGETGTKLKCEILGKYYDLWWSITSGGQSNQNQNHTAIIEMNAGSGEDYIKDTGEIILGSSGHALNLKTNNNSQNLKVLLVEENQQCFDHLTNVIQRRWPNLRFSIATKDTDEDVLLFDNSRNALRYINQNDLGNALFFFDPLLFESWNEIEFVAKSRIAHYYQTGTEFIIFLFTSDWFLGRDISPLPTTTDEKRWTDAERNTVSQLEQLFGYVNWKDDLLNQNSLEDKMNRLVRLYQVRLHKWFRYVVPFPFKPKPEQTYHLFMCSNYEVGISLTRTFYTKYTNNKKYEADFKSSEIKFKNLHPETIIQRRKAPNEFRILRRIVTHEEGLCDKYCRDLREIMDDPDRLEGKLEWLASKGYLRRIVDLTNAWSNRPQPYQLDWDVVTPKLKIEAPLDLKPVLSISEIKNQQKKNLTMLDFMKDS